MNEKACILTGFTSGIGKETAFVLAEKGIVMGLVCRDKEKGEKVIEEIKSGTKNADVHLFVADLSSQKEIRKAASEIKSGFPVIDILINNAGGINDNRLLTDDGYELTFAVNHLAYFLLTNLLLENLKAAPDARIVNVASDAHKFSKIDFNDLNMEKGYNPMKAYGITKLANILFTYELSKKLEGTSSKEIVG